MSHLDSFMYKLKHRFPLLYRFLEMLGAGFTVWKYRKKIIQVTRENRVVGKIQGLRAEIRMIGVNDSFQFLQMIAGIPKEHLKFFSPHGMDEHSIRRVLSRMDILTYGLFVEDQMKAYALLKLFPTGKAYIGRLVLPELTGLGIGKFLSRYLYWQAYLLKIQPCSTIHDDNIASLHSHQSVRPFCVVGRLPGNFNLIEFKISEEDKSSPELLIGEEMLR